MLASALKFCEIEGPYPLPWAEQLRDRSRERPAARAGPADIRPGVHDPLPGSSSALRPFGDDQVLRPKSPEARLLMGSSLFARVRQGYLAHSVRWWKTTGIPAMPTFSLAWLAGLVSPKEPHLSETEKDSRPLCVLADPFALLRTRFPVLRSGGCPLRHDHRGGHAPAQL
jgi:hypothetical protein